MATMTFRFTTECELTLTGVSYEDIYLRLKDFMHGDMKVPTEGSVAVYPPATDQLFFQVDDDARLYEVPYFKGAFEKDVSDICRDRSLRAQPPLPQSMSLSPQAKQYIPDFYW